MSTAASAAPVRGPAHRARARGPRADTRTVGARDVVIAILGGIGILTIAWLAVSAAFGLSLIVFVTGSMSPTMPTGAVAITQNVTAASLEPGDVVTVTRPGGSTPVTHRIVEIAPVAGDADARALTLRGDANSVVDSDRYVVTETRRVIAAAPALGWAVIAAKTPTAILVLTFSVAAAIAWALWPGRTPAHRRHPHEEH